MIYLPPVGTHPVCPKCGGVEILIYTVHHIEPVPVSPMMSAVPDPCTVLVIETPSEELEGFHEHLCKRCGRCGFGWVEQVLTEGSVYRDPTECVCEHHGDHGGCDGDCPCAEGA